MLEITLTEELFVQSGTDSQLGPHRSPLIIDMTQSGMNHISDMQLHMCSAPAVYTHYVPMIMSRTPVYPPLPHIAASWLSAQ